MVSVKIRHHPRTAVHGEKLPSVKEDRHFCNVVLNDKIKSNHKFCSPYNMVLKLLRQLVKIATPSPNTND